MALRKQRRLGKSIVRYSNCCNALLAIALIAAFTVMVISDHWVFALALLCVSCIAVS